MAGFSLVGVQRPGGGIGEEMESMAAFELSQALTVPGKLRSRREASQAEGRVLEARLAAARREIAAEVRAGYARLFAIDREAEALGAAGDLLDLLSESAAARYAAGEGDLADPARAQLERARLAERLDDLLAERTEVEARLNGLLDRPPSTPVRPEAELPGPRVDAEIADLLSLASERDALAAQAAGRSPEVRMRSVEVAAAERGVRAARLARWPDLVLGAEYGHRGRLDPMVTARVAVDLPVWKRGKQDAEVRAAERELRAREADLRASRARVEAEADERLTRLLVADRQARRLREEIVPQADLMVEARRAAYAAGRGDFGRLVEALRTRLEARSDAARRDADRFEAWARWQAVAGPDFGSSHEARAARGAGAQPDRSGSREEH